MRKYLYIFKEKIKGMKAGYVVFACLLAICFFMATSFFHSMPNNYIKTHYARVDAAGSNLKTVDTTYRDLAEYVAAFGTGSSGLVYLAGLNTNFYYIYSASALRSFSSHINSTSAQEGTNNVTNAILMCDIDLGTSNFTAIGSYSRKYKGIFLGCGHKISNLKATDSAGNDRGLFGYVDGGATIWNVIIDSGTIYCDGGNSAGAIAGYLGGGSQIIGCQNWGCSVTEASSGSLNVGGIAGWVEGSSVIAGCYNKASVSANSNNSGSDLTRRAGGIAGRAASSTIMECKNTGSVSAGNSSTTSQAYAGGIVGYSYESLVVNCLIRGATISASAKNTDSGSTGNIMRTYKSYGGGVIGYCESVNYYATLQYCYVSSCTITGGKVQHIYSNSTESGWITTGWDVRQDTVSVNGGPFVSSYKRQQIEFKYSVSSTVDISKNVDDFVGGGVFSYYGLSKSSNTCSRNNSSVSYSTSSTIYYAESNRTGSTYDYGFPNLYYINNKLGTQSPSYSNKGTVSASDSHSSSGEYKYKQKSFSSVSTTFTPYRGSGYTLTTKSDFYVESYVEDGLVWVTYCVLFSGDLSGGLSLGGFGYQTRSATTAKNFSDRDTTDVWFTKDSYYELRYLYWEGSAEMPA